VHKKNAFGALIVLDKTEMPKTISQNRPLLQKILTHYEKENEECRDTQVATYVVKAFFQVVVAQ
jgi:hypothetical protein